MQSNQDKIDVITLKAEHGTRFISADDIRRAEGGWFEVDQNAWSYPIPDPQNHPVGIRAVAAPRAGEEPPHPYRYELDLSGTASDWSPRPHTWRPNVSRDKAEVVAIAPSL